MVIDNSFELKQIVYLITDTDQRPRIVTRIKVGVSGLVYELCCGTCISDHYDFEISDSVNVLSKME